MRVTRSVLWRRNLPFDAEEEDVEEQLEQFGELVYSKVVVDPNTEASRGASSEQCCGEISDVCSVIAESVNHELVGHENYCFQVRRLSNSKTRTTLRSVWQPRMKTER